MKREYGDREREYNRDYNLAHGKYPGFRTNDELDALEANDHLGAPAPEYHAAHTMRGSYA